MLRLLQNSADVKWFLHRTFTVTESVNMDVVFVNGSEGLCSVKFKAGLMSLQNGKMVADPRKGTIKIVQVRIQRFENSVASA